MSSHARGIHRGPQITAWLKRPKAQRMAETQRPPQRFDVQPDLQSPVRVSLASGSSGAGPVPASQDADRKQKALDSFRETVTQLSQTRERIAALDSLKELEATLVQQSPAGHQYCVSLGLEVAPPPVDMAPSEPRRKSTITKPPASAEVSSHDPALAGVGAA